MNGICHRRPIREKPIPKPPRDTHKIPESKSPSKSETQKKSEASSKSETQTQAPSNPLGDDKEYAFDRKTKQVVLVLLVGCLFLGAYVVLSMLKPQSSCDFGDLFLDGTYADMLRFGIQDVRDQKEQLAVYLLVHEGINSTDSLPKAIAERTSTCLNTPQVHLTLDDFTDSEVLEDYGKTIDRLKAKLKEGHVVTVANLNQVPGKTAFALKFICDTYTPIDENVIYFLTVVVPKMQDGPTKGARQYLWDLWNKQLSEDELGAVLTRITNHVIPLYVL